MTGIEPLGFVALGFIIFSLVLLAVPIILVAKKTKPWRDVAGLWIAGWGFLLIGLGTWFARAGWAGVVVPGVVVTTVGHLMQRRVGSRRPPT
ncbi:MAG TPA: hypothetical protein VJ997_13200 [Longimicrobiales bacterium]|nr:hypothetical protein [Longimicrobiales bacterium]